MALWRSTALAQVPFVSAGQDVDAQAERFRKEYADEKRTFQVESAEPSIDVQEPKRKKLEGQTRFRLKDIRIEGMDTIEPSKLQYLWEGYLEHDVDLNDLQDIADKIKGVYKEFGFLTTVVFVPPQDIKGGVVTIQVAEGKIGKVIVSDNHWFSERLVRKYVAPYRGKRLNIQAVQKDMMRLNENPDVNVSAVLSPGDEPQTTDITLKVKERVPYHVTVGMDNQGSRLVGRWRHYYSFNSTNISGRLDQLFVSTTTTENSFGQYVAYRLPIGTQGFKVGMDVGFYQLKLGEELKAYDITGVTKIFDPNVGWEISRSLQNVTTAKAGFKVKDIEKKQGLNKTTNDRLWIPYASIDYVHLDAGGQTNINPEISFGTSNFLGSTGRDNTLASRNKSNGVFAKLEQSMSRTQKMPFDSYAQVKAQGQIASNTLPSSEQMQLGGAKSIRGYSDGDFMADVGASLNCDWIFPMYVIPEDWKIRWSDTNLRHQIEPVIFFDAGAGQLIKNYTTERDNKFLMSAGIGLRLHMNKNFNVRLEWADPLGETPVRGNGPSVFSISMQAGI